MKELIPIEQGVPACNTIYHASLSDENTITAEGSHFKKPYFFHNSDSQACPLGYGMYHNSVTTKT